MRSNIVLYFGIVIGCVGTSSAAVVPFVGPPSQLQGFLNGVQPGDTVLLPNGVFPPLTLTKAITLIGSSASIIDGSVDQPNVDPIPVITLAGAGSGVLTLSRLTVYGQLTFNAGITGTCAAGITGGGFGELRITDCTVYGIGHTTEIDGGFFGSCGGDAVNVSVPYLLIERSKVYGASALPPYEFYDHPVPGAHQLNSGRGVATTGKLVVLDSSIYGGSGTSWSNTDADPFGVVFPEPPPCSPVEYAAPAEAVSATSVVHANSDFHSGLGGSIYCDGQSQGSFTSASNYLPNEIHLANDLHVSAPLEINKGWALQLPMTVDPKLLIVGLPAQHQQVAGAHLFVNPGALILIPVPGGLSVLVLDAHVSLALTGLPIMVQYYSATTGLSRPVYSVLNN